MFPSDAFILKESRETDLKVSNFLIFFYGIKKKKSNEEGVLEDLGRQNPEPKCRYDALLICICTC